MTPAELADIMDHLEKYYKNFYSGLDKKEAVCYNIKRYLLERSRRRMAKIKWRGGTLLAPVPPALVTCSDGERENVLTVAWTGIVNSDPPKTYISVRPSRYSYDIIKKSGALVHGLQRQDGFV